MMGNSWVVYWHQYTDINRLNPDYRSTKRQIHSLWRTIVHDMSMLLCSACRHLALLSNFRRRLLKSCCLVLMIPMWILSAHLLLKLTTLFVANVEARRTRVKWHAPFLADILVCCFVICLIMFAQAQCGRCQAWQHVVCYGYWDSSFRLPDKHFCYTCLCNDNLQLLEDLKMLCLFRRVICDYKDRGILSKKQLTKGTSRCNFVLYHQRAAIEKAHSWYRADRSFNKHTMWSLHTKLLIPWETTVFWKVKARKEVVTNWTRIRRKSPTDSASTLIQHLR